jgi:nicotinate-nucleotide--dimethylbenzimidazole phosphoribosyltransferase
VQVVDMGVKGDLSDLAAAGRIRRVHIGNGTGNMAAGPAMTRDQAVRSIEAGIEIVRELAPTTDVFGTGDMGIGNTTPSSAIVAVLTEVPVEEVTGCGTGIDEERRRMKAAVIRKALDLNRPDPDEGLDILAKVGGFEIGGIAGVVLGAASVRKPVVVDGFISTAGALIAQKLCPQAASFMIAAHRSVERGHVAALERLGKKPLMDLDLRLGEGTGAALAMTIVEAAVRVLTEVATFGEAGVSEAG